MYWKLWIFLIWTFTWERWKVCCVPKSVIFFTINYYILSIYHFANINLEAGKVKWYSKVSSALEGGSMQPHTYNRREKIWILPVKEIIMNQVPGPRFHFHFWDTLLFVGHPLLLLHDATGKVVVLQKWKDWSLFQNYFPFLKKIQVLNGSELAFEEENIDNELHLLILEFHIDYKELTVWTLRSLADGMHLWNKTRVSTFVWYYKWVTIINL